MPNYETYFGDPSMSLHSNSVFERRAEVVRRKFPGAFQTTPLSDDGPTHLSAGGGTASDLTDDWDELDPPMSNDESSEDFLYIPRGNDSSDDEHQVAYAASRDLDELIDELVADVDSEDQEEFERAVEKAGLIHALAWYHPIHAQDASGRWGISVHDRRFRTAIKRLAKLGGIDRGGAALILKAEIDSHEMFHHRVEKFALAVQESQILEHEAGRAKLRPVYLDYSSKVYEPTFSTTENIEEALATRVGFEAVPDWGKYQWERGRGGKLTLSYGAYDQYLSRTKYGRAIDRLGAIVAEGKLDASVRPVRFPPDSASNYQHVPIRSVGIKGGDSLYSEISRFFRPAIRDLIRCARQFGIDVVQTGRGRHPAKWEIRGHNVKPFKVGRDNRVSSDKVLTDLEIAAGIPKGTLRECLTGRRTHRRHPVVQSKPS
jgi:hypothetical protein